MLMKFECYPASSTAIFSCPKCGKEKRRRTFRAECTVNPFNKRDDGTPRNASEVRAQSVTEAAKERDEFMREPLCATCENCLSWAARGDLFKRRRTLAQS